MGVGDYTFFGHSAHMVTSARGRSKTQRKGWSVEDKAAFGDRNGFAVFLQIFEAKFRHFAGALHKRVQVFRLRVASAQFRHVGHKEAFLITLDYNSELTFCFHAILPPAKV